MRVKFRKGEQRKFIELVLAETYSPSLRALRQYGIDANYQTLKSYYGESRTLPLELFEDLCKLSGIDRNSVKFKLLDDNWGKVKGGRK